MTVLLEILAIAVLALLTARFAPQPWRSRILNGLNSERPDYVRLRLTARRLRRLAKIGLACA